MTYQTIKTKKEIAIPFDEIEWTVAKINGKEYMIFIKRQVILKELIKPKKKKRYYEPKIVRDLRKIREGKLR